MSGLTKIPVIDVFAGPGGLGEGFSALRDKNGNRRFDVRLSIECDPFAHRTLTLRSFFRQFEPGKVPARYYEYLRGECDAKEPSLDWLFSEFPREASRARDEAWRATLGEESPEIVSDRVTAAIGSGRWRRPWVLIGGPPCQAYSIAGRSRLVPKIGKRFYKDRRHTLYQEYLRLLADHAPTVFIMENVKGLLSSRLNNGYIFEQILADLRQPRPELTYDLFPLVEHKRRSAEALFDSSDEEPLPGHFVIEAEKHGIPQARHRVIILGVLRRHGARRLPRPTALEEGHRRIPCWNVIARLPRIRAGVSRQADSDETWRSTIMGASQAPWFAELRANGQTDVANEISKTLTQVRVPRRARGGRFVAGAVSASHEPDWFLDRHIGGACNHEGRLHMADDFHRYLYAACFARVNGLSPLLEDFPPALRPNHENVGIALQRRLFNDRFRVQIRDLPATTVTSHIAKDGHYFIHPDPAQCRSLTVREAARIQTFPDNYFFEGPRTEQYRQVGNAVPPLLALQIANIVSEILT